MKKLNTILLIDDDPATNFLHKYLIEKENCADEIICLQSAEDALAYLKDNIKKGFHYPELIFLDINMPRMNGWEFLQAYKELTKSENSSKIVVMLTTSLDPIDKKKAEEIEEINEFLSKPLSAEKIHKILALSE